MSTFNYIRVFSDFVNVFLYRYTTPVTLKKIRILYKYIHIVIIYQWTSEISCKLQMKAQNVVCWTLKNTH